MGHSGDELTEVDRLVLWVLRQTVSSLVFQMEQAEKWVGPFTPT